MRYEQTRIYKSLVDFKIEFFRQHKDLDKNQIKDKEVELEKDWFNIIYSKALKGKKIDKKTLNDISTMNNSKNYLNKLEKLK